MILIVKTVKVGEKEIIKKLNDDPYQCRGKIIELTNLNEKVGAEWYKRGRINDETQFFLHYDH